MKQELSVRKIATQFRKELELNWCKESSHRTYSGLAGPGKSVGQCFVSSLLLQEKLRKDLPETKTKIARGGVVSDNGKLLISNHGWVEIEDNNDDYWNLDITLDQSGLNIPVYFDRAVNPKDPSIVFAKEKYLSKNRVAGDLKKRLDLLRNRLQNHEEHCCDKKLVVGKYLQIGNGKGKHILAVAESPAANGWRKSGRAFYTLDDRLIPTGKNFLANLKQIDDELELRTISFTEIVKCFIGNDRKKLDECAAKTWEHFIIQVGFVNPKLILLLGQRTTDIFNRLASTSLKVGEISEVTVSNSGYFILPIYHPSPANPRRFLNRGIIDNNLKIIREAIK